MSESKKFSHLTDEGRPTMVDVGSKMDTQRRAHARAIVELPSEVIEVLDGDEIHVKKGPVFQTAILAGIMGIKKTSELIPLCHPLPISNCSIDISVHKKNSVVIDSVVSVFGKTGVEMEALTGASIAALTIYDMCKGFSHDIVIRKTELISKKGGKNDFQRKT